MPKSSTNSVKQSREIITEINPPKKMTLGWIILTCLCTANDLIDIVFSPLNLTGIWALIPLGIDVFFLMLIFSWKLINGDFKSLINWKTILSLILEHIPIIGDIWTGWIATMFIDFKRKTKKPAKIQASG